MSPIADINAVLLVMCMGLSFCFWDLHRSGLVNSNVACLFVYLVIARGRSLWLVS